MMIILLRQPLKHLGPDLEAESNRSETDEAKSICNGVANQRRESSITNGQSPLFHAHNIYIPRSF